MKQSPKQTVANALLARALAVPRQQILRGILVIAALLLLVTCAPNIGTWAEIQHTGTLRMATVNSAKTYYLDAGGPAGFEYDLARRFARSLGLELAVLVVPNRRAALAAVRRGDAHFAAGLAITPARRELVRFTPPYHHRTLQAVVHTNSKTPDGFEQLTGELVVPAYTAAASLLQRKHPDANFHVEHNANSEELLALVAQEKLYATIAASAIVMLNQRYYPELRTAFELDTKPALAWAFPRRFSGVLYNKAVAFIQRMRDSKALRSLRDRYFGHADRLGFVGGMVFAKAVDERLHQWRDEFEAAAKRYHFDWRLLAAVSYQESHWEPQAVSPTGVRGMMMLTEPTAKQMGIEDRTDPQASIRGGSKYLRYLLGRLPDSITGDDRLWTALAAYNVGLGHVLDGRRLLQARGLDPDRWVNLRTALEWLTRESYYQHTRYGYARGHQAVTYVGNIRAYYDILRWMTRRHPNAPSDSPTQTPPAETSNPEERALKIDTPAL